MSSINTSQTSIWFDYSQVQITLKEINTFLTSYLMNMRARAFSIIIFVLHLQLMILVFKHLIFEQRTNMDTFIIQNVSLEDVQQIYELGKAPGPDSISHHMLKNTKDTMFSVIYASLYIPFKSPIPWTDENCDGDPTFF